MATIRQMREKYGSEETARILTLEGYPVNQRRVVEAFKPRKGRTEAAERDYFELDRMAHEINLSKYPKGVAEGPNVVQVRGSMVGATPVYQYRYQKAATRADLEARKVTGVETGNYPTKTYDDRLVWDASRTKGEGKKRFRPNGPRVIPNRTSIENLIDTAVRRFGPNRPVAIKLFGVFAADFGRYLPSERFPGWKEDFYSHHVTLGRVRAARDVAIAQVNADLRSIPSGDTKRRRWAVEGNPADPENWPSFGARWATALTGIGYLEVNYVDLWPEGRA